MNNDEEAIRRVVAAINGRILEISPAAVASCQGAPNRRTGHPLRDSVRWPDRYAPERSPVYVRNELTMHVRCAAAWAWLVRARLWPTWYRNSANVDYLNSDSADLAAGTRFRWKTFGVTLESTVLELVPGERIAWDAHGPGVDAYHAWVFRPTAEGCDVLTEETQHGWLARVAHLTMPNRMHKYHQVWLEALRDQAARGLPPAESPR